MNAYLHQGPAVPFNSVKSNLISYLIPLSGLKRLPSLKTFKFNRSKFYDLHQIELTHRSQSSKYTRTKILQCQRRWEKKSWLCPFNSNPLFWGPVWAATHPPSKFSRNPSSSFCVSVFQYCRWANLQFSYCTIPWNLVCIVKQTQIWKAEMFTDNVLMVYYVRTATSPWAAYHQSNF